MTDPQIELRMFQPRFLTRTMLLCGEEAVMTKNVIAFGVLACFVATSCYAQTNPMCAAAGEAAKWAPEQDAVPAAPKNHRVLLESDELRVLEVTVQPGERESVHHHQWPSVMVVTSRPTYVNYDAKGDEIRPATQASPEMPIVARLPSQAAHSIHVTDSDRPFHAIRIELKKLCPPG